MHSRDTHDRTLRDRRADRRATAAGVAQANARATAVTHAARRLRPTRRIGGNVTILFLVVATTLLLMATYGIALGQAYLGHAQLRVIADASSRAAVSMIRDGAFPLAARDMASLIALRTEAIEPGIFLVNDDVIFGDYDFNSRTFTPNGDLHAPAVHVTARRTSSSLMGPLDVAVGLFYGENTFELDASATATFGCREVVFAIDASAGMAEEFDDALRLVRDFKREMERSPRSGDKIGVTFYAAAAASIDDYAESGGIYWPGGDPDPLTQLSLDGVHIDDGLAAYASEGVCQDFRDRLAGAGRGSCAGKGDQHGIDQALELFERMGTDSCSISRERLIVLVTSGMPCAVFGPAINDFATPYYGGTRLDAFAAAERADALGVSIAPVRIDRGAPADGDYCRNVPLAIREGGLPTLYLSSLARGFVEAALVEPNPADLRDLISEFNQNLAVRVVE